MLRKIKILTRKSPLAMWQAEHVSQLLLENNKNIAVEIIGIKTTGDKILDQSLSKIGGKGLFIKEIEEALLAGVGDIAVHSMKDMPPSMHEDLSLIATPKRESPFDIFLSEQYPNLKALPQRATIGTSSLRRAAQLLYLRPDLQIKSLRGNIDTRVQKLQACEYDAIVLAEAGVNRLNLKTKYGYTFGLNEMVPAIAQGALGLQVRKNEGDLFELFQGFHCNETAVTVQAERAFGAAIQASCQTPLGAHATLMNGQITLTTVLAHPQGTICIKETRTKDASEREILGREVAAALIAQGGKEILKECKF